MKKISILNLPEDLLNENPVNVIDQACKVKQKFCIEKNNHTANDLVIETLVVDIAKILKISTQELSDWAQASPAPESLLKTILKIARRLKLNPLLGHIDWESNRESGYEFFISIDGWIAMIHQESTFQGLTFDQAAENENGIPAWMECTIYRSDFTYPITVREYFAEVKTEHPVWQVMPRRMLRHKTLQQCARLAFGISVPEFKSQLPHSKIKAITPMPKNQTSVSGKTKLKEKLYKDQISN